MKISFLKSIDRRVLTTFAICIAIATFTHGFGMFHYPYYEGDEGSYTSQAWSLVKEGNLSPYDYWYDHPPFGWITMAAWTVILGGNFFVFGDSSIDNMRFFMLLIHLVSASLVFIITYKLSKRTTIATVATLLFTLSPLFIFYQRRVLIDNVMTMWILLSYAVLLSYNLTTKRVLLSGVFFGFALLTKIPALVFLPAFLYTLCLSDWPIGDTVKRVKKDYIKRSVVWLLGVFCIGMIFILFTVLKGEFLPPSVTGKDHFSLISGIQFQLSRDSEEFFWEENSYFRGALDDWLYNDRFSVVIIAIGIAVGFVAAWKNVIVRSLMVFVALYLAFLLRGGIVTNFYVLPLIPFAAIATAMSFWWLTEKFVQQDNLWKTYVGTFTLLAIIFTLVSSKKPYTVDDTTNQKQAITWIKENIDQDKKIMMDVQGLVDLWDTDYVNDKSFRQSADWFSKVLNDNNIQNEKLGGDYKNIDYILSSHELLRQLKNVEDDRMGKQAYLSSAPIKDWTARAGHLNEMDYSSGIGNWAKLYEVDRPRALTVEKAWRTYKQDYVRSYGQILDPDGAVTTSEGQSYGMLRAIFAHDQSMYDDLWQWTRDQFQHRSNDSLLSSQWQEGRQTVSDNSTFADANIAASLALASMQWDDTSREGSYRDQAVEMMQDLWNKSVVTIDGQHFMLATDQASDIHVESSYIVNPSFLTPVWYELFSQFDTGNPWKDLATSSYKILEDNLTPQGKVVSANALELNRETAILTPLDEGQSTIEGKENLFGGDFYRSIWLAALDIQWYDNSQAMQYLNKISDQELMTQALSYNFTTNNLTSPLSAYSAYLMVTEPDKAREFYEQHFESLYDHQRNAWGTSDTYYSANWMWLGAALYNDLILPLGE